QGLRPDGRAALGRVDGVVRQWRRLLPLFVLGRAWLRPHRAGGHIRPGLPADRRSVALRPHAIAEQDQAHPHHLTTLGLPPLALNLDSLQAALTGALGSRIRAQVVDRGQLTIEVAPEALLEAGTILRDDETLAFTELLDLIGIDYQGWGDRWEGARYAVVYNLISIRHNVRLRVRLFCADDGFPAVDSAIG